MTSVYSKLGDHKKDFSTFKPGLSKPSTAAPQVNQSVKVSTLNITDKRPATTMTSVKATNSPPVTSTSNLAQKAGISNSLKSHGDSAFSVKTKISINSVNLHSSKPSISEKKSGAQMSTFQKEQNTNSIPISIYKVNPQAGSPVVKKIASPSQQKSTETTSTILQKTATTLQKKNIGSPTSASNPIKPAIVGNTNIPKPLSSQGSISLKNQASPKIPTKISEAKINPLDKMKPKPIQNDKEKFGQTDKDKQLQNEKNKLTDKIKVVETNKISEKNNDAKNKKNSVNEIQNIVLNIHNTAMLLLSAAKQNDLEKCKEILAGDFDMSIDTNFKGEHEFTSLHYACQNNNLNLVNLLIYHECLIDPETDTKMTPLMLACKNGNDEITSILLNAGAEVNFSDNAGNVPLHYAVLSKNIKCLDTLLKKTSILINKPNNQGLSPIQIATEEPIKNLLQKALALNLKAASNQNKISIPTYKDDSLTNMYLESALIEEKKEKKPQKKTVSTPKKQQPDLNLENGISKTCETSPDKIDSNIIGPHSFKILGLIGKGSFGEVFLVEKLDTKQIFAMKVLEKDKIMKQNLIKYALTERNVLSITNHPFIVKMNYAFQTTNKLFLILDYCSGGDLSLHLQREKKFNEDKTRIYLAEILLALEDLHKRDIIFRDLKPDNIVIDSDGHALLTDFGLSKEGVYDSKQGAKSFCGSMAYLAPEMLKRTGHGKAVDWYLLGVVCYEMLVGVPPYYARTKEQLFQNIEKAPLKFPANLSEQAKSLIKGLLQRNPAVRLGSGKGGSEEIKNHEFFKIIDWAGAINRKLVPPKPTVVVHKDLMKKVQREFTEQTDENKKINGWSFVNNGEQNPLIQQV